MVHAITRGANGRRQEVDLKGADITIQIFSDYRAVEIVVEASEDRGSPRGAHVDALGQLTVIVRSQPAARGEPGCGGRESVT